MACCHPGSSSDSEEISLSDEAEEDGPDIPACTPLAAFLSFKQEAERRRASQVQLEATAKVANLCHHLMRKYKFTPPQIGASAVLLNLVCVCVCTVCTGQLAESPLVAVMSHLLSFLEQYSHFQQLQQQADQYRVQLKRHRVQHRRQMKALRASYRQRLRDKNSIISSLEEAIGQQQTPSPLSEGEGGGEGAERRGWGEGEIKV